MIEQLAHVSRPVLDMPIVRRIRRNHGLEHATIHVLSSRVKGLRVAGRSSDSGFVLLGEVPTEQVESAVHEALERMRKGEHSLAVHPNCGTNLLTSGTLTTLVGLLGLSGASHRSKFDRLPLVLLLMMFAILFAQPLGMSLQKHFTTRGDPGDLEVVRISRRKVGLPLLGGAMTVHTVVTQGG